LSPSGAGLLIRKLESLSSRNNFAKLPITMDPVRNPYAPGAGSPPPELAGRNEIREDIRVRLARLRLGRPAKSMMLIGLRGVGKTVLLDQMRRDAEAGGI